jgi:glutamyl-tRNA synthetase
MGIAYHEGPDMSGDYGPYVQSQRLDLYREHARQLIEQGDAYYCFCTPERLEEMRRKQENKKQQPKYDGTCRQLSKQDIEQKLGSGLSHVTRLKMPEEGVTRFNDIIRGEISVQNDLTDDQILIKSDNYPTYHLANVIDDHYMQISHVIRGEEWLLSVPKHIRLYQAFDWEIPQMAHLPLLLNPNRTKLSKRQGDVAVEDFLHKGYVPEALLNFVALLGWNPGTDQELFSLQELTDKFSLERVNKAGAIFDLQKLNWMNGHFLRQLTEDQRFEFLQPFLNKAGYNTSDSAKTGKVISAVSQRISYGEEIKQAAAICYSDTLKIEESEAKEIIKKTSTQQVLSKFLEKLSDISTIDVEKFKSIMKGVQEETGFKKEDLWMPIRIGLTGVTHGPDLPIVLEVFGKEKVENFIRQALAYKN